MDTPALKLAGWIVRQSRPIAMREWIDFALRHKNLVQMQPVSVINPFTRGGMNLSRVTSCSWPQGLNTDSKNSATIS